MSQAKAGGRRMLNEQHLHTHLLTNKLHEGFAANYAQFFSTFSFKSGQTTQQKITQRTKRKKRRKNYPISFNVYICPMKFNLIKGQAGQKRRKERKGEWIGEEQQRQHKSISAPKGRSCTKGWGGGGGMGVFKWNCFKQRSGEQCALYFVPCRISLSSHVPCPLSRVRCPYPVSFWPIADCLTVTCLLAFNFICDALPLTWPKPISLLVFKEAANWTPPQLALSLCCSSSYSLFPFFFWLARAL